MRLEQDCDLGEAGRWFGWQCRWYDLPKDLSLGKTRRDAIEDAIAKAKRHVPDLTDFVLCLRELPTKDDVDWYFGLDVGIRLHLWADEEIESRLVGDAAILRQAYFGDLVLTTEQLAESHERSIEPIKRRWLPELHVETQVQEYVERPLLRPGGCEDVRDQAARLDRVAQALREGRGNVSGEDLAQESDRLAGALEGLSAELQAVVRACDERHPAEARERVSSFELPTVPVPDVRRLARALRGQRIPSAVAASAAEAEIRHAIGLVAERRKLMIAALVAVVGDAGRGKTQLAAELTAPSEEIPAGIFIKGWDLRSGETMDDLAARLPGIEIPTFDSLLEAVDAAGARNGVRIPIVIDGLNDAERPGEWEQQLGQVKPILARYEYVLLLVTLRGAVRDVLPDGSAELELAWQDVEVAEATRRYFEHYRIDAGSIRLPMGLFRNPLFLRMFCEAVNPDRTESVGVEAIPASLVGVFELYHDRTDERLRQRPGHPTLPRGQVKKKLAALATELWNRGTRELPFDDARQLVDGSEQDWDRSLIRALLEEGVLFRDDEAAPGDRVAILFDRLAGHLIADALLGALAINQLDDSLGSDELWTKLRGATEERHPLAADVLVALVGLLPRRFSGKQVWKLAPDGARDWALAQTLDLESRFLDTETIDALAELVPRSGAPRPMSRHPFDRLWEIRDGVDHQLNAVFLDRVLRSMSVAGRDLRWSEWIRANAADIGHDLDELESRWSVEDTRDAQDDLNARAVTWLLTTTSLPIRDRATRALERYGRADPGRLFAHATELLGVNDPYVTERLLAASFGAATAHQMPDPGGSFERSLGGWLNELRRRYLGTDAASPTSHDLARQYISGCFELAGRLHPTALPEGIDIEALGFGPGPDPEPIPEDDDRAEECDQTFGMDFENYIVGSLFEDRANYQMDHPAFVAGLADVRGRIWNLGWRADDFADIDNRIGSDQWRRHENPDRIERYGKKYGWISYYELAGRLNDRDELQQREWLMGRGVWPDIDPTFPERPPDLSIAVPSWASAGPGDDATWYRHGTVEVPDDLLTPDVVDDEPGPWIAVEGSLQHRDADRGRRVWGFLRGVLVEADEADTLRGLLEEREYLGNHYVPDSPSDMTTFAGEIPWSARFEANGDMENGLAPYHVAVTERWDEPGVQVELLGHEYSLATERTVTNEARGHWVPSHRFAAEFQLRERPQTLDLVTLDGRAASLTRNAPAGFEGKVLFLRRDLLAEYARGRKLVQVAWGEREVDVDWANAPEWVQEVRSDHSDLWRHVRLVTP